MNVRFLAFNAYCCQMKTLRISLLLSFLLVGGIAAGQIKVDLPYSPIVFQPEQSLSQFSTNANLNEVAQSLNFSEVNRCAYLTDFKYQNNWNSPASLVEGNSVTYNWYAFNTLFNQIDSTTLGYRFANNLDKNYLQAFYKNSFNSSVASCWTVRAYKTSNFPATYPANYYDKKASTFNSESNLENNRAAVLIQTVQSFYDHSQLPYSELSNRITSSDKGRFQNIHQLSKIAFENKYKEKINLIARSNDENFTVTWKGNFVFTTTESSFSNFTFQSNIILDTEQIIKVTEGIESDFKQWTQKSYFVASRGNKTYRVPSELAIQFSFQKQSKMNSVPLDLANETLFYTLLKGRYKGELKLPVNTQIKYSTFSTTLTTGDSNVIPLETDVMRVLSIDLPKSYGALPMMSFFGRGYKNGTSGSKRLFSTSEKNKRCATQKFMVIGFAAGTLSGLTRFFANSLYNEDPIRYKNSPNVANVSTKVLTGSCILYSAMIVIDFSRTLHLVKTTKRKIAAINSMLDENVIYSK